MFNSFCAMRDARAPRLCPTSSIPRGKIPKFPAFFSIRKGLTSERTAQTRAPCALPLRLRSEPSAQLSMSGATSACVGSGDLKQIVQDIEDLSQFDSAFSNDARWLRREVDNDCVPWFAELFPMETRAKLVPFVAGLGSKVESMPATRDAGICFRRRALRSARFNSTGVQGPE